MFRCVQLYCEVLLGLRRWTPDGWLHGRHCPGSDLPQRGICAAMAVLLMFRSNAIILWINLLEYGPIKNIVFTLFFTHNSGASVSSHLDIRHIA